MLDAVSGVLVGLGLLGTFLGLTLGIKGFDSSNTERINESIQGLLAGMGTAFYTSLAGMIASILFTGLDKAFRYRLYKYTKELTDNLDSEFYIDDIELANLNQQKIVNQLYKALKTDIQDQASSIVAKLTYNNAEVKMSQLVMLYVRFLLRILSNQKLSCHSLPIWQWN